MKKVFLILLLIMSLILVACGNTTTKKESTNSTANEKATTDEVKEEEEVVSDDDLSKLLANFPETPAEKVITTSVPLAEILHSLDITPVGVPTSTNPLPEAFQDIDEIGSPMAPDLEKMTMLEADLILSSTALEESL